MALEHLHALRWVRLNVRTTPHAELRSVRGEKEREAEGDIHLEGLRATRNSLRIIGNDIGIT
jgi:hypothetical protein